MSEFGHRRTLLSYLRFSPESEHSSARSTGMAFRSDPTEAGPLATRPAFRLLTLMDPPFGQTDVCCSEVLSWLASNHQYIRSTYATEIPA
jgi:hypothetical protein